MKAKIEYVSSLFLTPRKAVKKKKNRVTGLLTKFNNLEFLVLYISPQTINEKTKKLR